MVDPYPDLRARGLISCMQCWQSAGSLLHTYGTHRNMLSITSSVLSRSTLLVRDEREYGLISCIHSQRRVSGRCEHGHVAQLTHSERIPPYRTVARGASYDSHIARHRSGIVTRRPDDSHCSLRSEHATGHDLGQSRAERPMTRISHDRGVTSSRGGRIERFACVWTRRRIVRIHCTMDTRVRTSVRACSLLGGSRGWMVGAEI